MAFEELPPDPYQALGVTKDAKLPEIRSAHRKLVLKCHPDKVQDAALKAIKQDEFQKVQQAYELLSDDNRRLQYDEQVKLYALRKDMAGARGKATSRSNPFEYEVKTAEPRATTYKYTSRPPPMPRETSKVYPQERPRSYENVVYEEPIRQAKKSASYESADRDRRSRRDEDRVRDARREEDERMRQKLEKESKRSAHGEKKKKDDKAKRRAGEEKSSSRNAYYEDDSSDEQRAARTKEKSRQEREKHRMEDEIRSRNEEARREEARAEAARDARRAESREAPLTPKWDYHKESAAQYMQAARRKAAPTPEDFRPRPMERAQTFAAPHSPHPNRAFNIHNIRHAEPHHPTQLIDSDDDDMPRRSSAPRATRKPSETPPSRSKDVPKSSSKEKPREKDREKEREKEKDKDRKRSGRSRSRDPYIVSPPDPPPLATMPKLQTHSSAPPIIPVVASRKEPSRSKTHEYPRDAPPPTLPRASTFQSGDRAPDRGTQRGSRLKNAFDYSSTSDSDSPIYTSNRHSHSPVPQSRRREIPEPTRYIIDNGRSVPITARTPHRAEMRNIDDEIPYNPRDRERSESPHGTGRHPRTNDRPPVARAGSGGTRQAPTRSHSQSYYPPPTEAPEPIVLTARPKMAPREPSYGHTSSSRTPRGSSGAPPPGGPYYGEVQYGKPYQQEDVIYNDAYRRGSDPNHHPHASRDYGYAHPPPMARGERIYAA